MAITVEDGTGITGANGFISAVDAVARLSELGYGGDVATVEPALHRAMLFFNGLKFKGTKTHAVTVNALPFPRTGIAIEDDPDSGDYGDNEIPANILIAIVMIVHYDINLGVSFGSAASVAGPAVRREKLEGLEIEYAVSTTDTTYARDVSSQLSQVWSLLKPFLKSGGLHRLNGRTARA